MRRTAAAAAVAVAASLVTAITAPAGAGQPAPAPAPAPAAVAYRAPVEAPLVDGFRPPSTRYGPGNRGVDYATAPGTPVGTAATGHVVFAGRVGGGLHVVVLHADGLRTSYSFLASVAVHRGQRVDAGAVLGASGPALHFGARAGDAYLDPLVLLGGGAGRAVLRLVPDDERTMGSEAAERRGLRRFLRSVTGAVAGVGGAAVGWARDTTVTVASAVVPSPADVRAWASAVGALASPGWVRVATAGVEWWQRRSACTPAGAAPPVPTGRRRLVLVGGLGSTSRSAGVDGVDAASLGYAGRDVARFSYRGGTTAERPYGAADTQVDLAASGRLLRDLLERLHAEDPGVPIDVVAHSQGGLVARSALGPRAPPGVENLVTLATPHQGADLATLLDVASRTPKGAVVLSMVRVLGLSSIDPTSAAVRQLSERSAFIRGLRRQPLPDGVRVTSIAARGDYVVASPRARLPGATNAVVSVPGGGDHAALPGAPAARRELALALAGRAPTCERLGDAVADVVAGEAIATAEDLAAAALVTAGR